MLVLFSVLFLTVQGGRHKRDTIRDQSRKWPGGRVPYVFSTSATLQTKEAFGGAIRELERVSCVRFVPRTYERDYARVISGDGCYSMIGKQGGPQILSLGNGCHRKGISVHETMHLLGFFHEQSRLDRDDHVTIHKYHVQDDAWNQFRKYRASDGDTLGEPYDPESLMHYDNKAFSKSGRSTITYKKNPWKKLGQREKLSDIDIRQLNKLYGCQEGNRTQPPTTRPTVECKDNVWARLSGECEFNAFMGLCRTGYRRMYEYCRHTCGYCRQTCLDTSNYCSYFLAHGYCAHNKRVRSRCKKTCRLC